MVEDNGKVRRLVSLLLEEIALVSIEADSLESALAVVASSRPLSMLISDQYLPDGHGVDLAQRARQLRPGLPVLLMSGTLLPEFGGAQILKPFEPEEFLNLVRRLL